VYTARQGGEHDHDDKQGQHELDRVHRFTSLPVAVDLCRRP